MAVRKLPVLNDANKLDGAVIDVETVAEGTTKKFLTAAERTKLAGVAPGATANAADAALRDRSTHTGTQAHTTITGLGDAATRTVGTGPTNVVVGSDARLVPLNGAADGMAVVFNAATGGLAFRTIAGGTATAAGTVGTVDLPVPPLALGDVFRSPAYEMGGTFPDGTYTSVRLESTANAAYTAVLQGSPNGIDGWYEVRTHTVTVANGAHTVAQTFTRPHARFVRWVITATATGMSSISAKATLA